MSNPAIVLMTDPSRCNLGDVQHLVQALLEMQQMGEHAIPQAFCDHPEAAGDFIDAYTHAYPQLVLEDREIPTPDHLHSLISSGQIGALGQPHELTPAGDLQPRAEPNGANGFPIVMLTLGSSQVLLDALQQAPAIRESIRLIDVGQERADALSVTVADAVAIRGLDGEPWQHARSGMDRLELDDIPGAWKADLTSLALHDDQMSLDVVEAAEVSSREPVYDHGGEHAPGPFEPPAAPQPAPVAVATPAAPLLPDDSLASTTATEPASEPASPPANQPIAARSSDSDPVEPEAQSLEPEAQAPVDAVDEGEGQVGQSPEGQDPGKNVDKGPGKNVDKGPGRDIDKGVDAAEDAGKVARDQDDDVHYPPVGSLIAGADVFYPALDQDGGHGALRELASVLLDDGIFDPDRASDFIEAQRGEDLPAPWRQEAIIAIRSGDKVVTLEDTYGAGEQDSEDQLADSDVVRPLHDSDL
jgi:hypothetical protein